MISSITLDRLVSLTVFVWAGGAVLLLALQFFAADKIKVKPLWLLLLSQIGILACVFAVAVLPQALVMLVLALFALRIAYEAVVVARLTPNKAHWKIALRYLAFPALPLAAFLFVWMQPGWRPALVLIILLVEIFDSFSLLGGKLLGRRKLIPKISPNKTVEGFYCGVGSLVVLGSLYLFDVEIPLAAALVVLVLAGIGAFVGDVVASIQKRMAGVKDYPAVIQIQGGLLDISDSWIVACPLVVAGLVLLGWGRF